MLLAASVAAVALAAPAHAPALTLKPCSVQTVGARCGTFRVAENRVKPNGRTIGLRVVVVPARAKPVSRNAFVFLAGGPGGAATQMTYDLTGALAVVNQHHDLLLVDQRGTGSSNAWFFTSEAQFRAFRGDPTQYTTRAAMDDLDAIRAALGYRQLDVYGISYGATAAQVFVQRHPTSVHTLTLAGATALDVSFYGRFARNSQHALDQIARLCSSDSACKRSFPGWERQFAELVRAWDKHPVQNRKGERTTGAGLAGIVQGMLQAVTSSVSIPLLVHAAAKGDYEPLNRALSNAAGGNGKPAAELLMYWSIWCQEPWVGLGAKGPWGTSFDSYARVSIEGHAATCAHFPSKPSTAWSFPHGTTPVLAIAGGADPQDPLTNLPRLRRSFPNSRTISIPYFGHDFPLRGCIGEVVASFVARRTAKGLDTSCVGAMVPPPFELP